jgi:hypothetical protein
MFDQAASGARLWLKGALWHTTSRCKQGDAFWNQAKPCVVGSAFFKTVMLYHCNQHKLSSTGA